ncbi:MAG: hypothetical protein K8T10_19975 [Candidatus Eremiobacteraeota bacterium]|nr:hypothetical protein [Candidatus Eremiobacteraeota bacterium]
MPIEPPFEKNSVYPEIDSLENSVFPQTLIRFKASLVVEGDEFVYKPSPEKVEMINGKGITHQEVTTVEYKFSPNPQECKITYRGTDQKFYDKSLADICNEIDSLSIEDIEGLTNFVNSFGLPGNTEATHKDGEIIKQTIYGVEYDISIMQSIIRIISKPREKKMGEGIIKITDKQGHTLENKAPFSIVFPLTKKEIETNFRNVYSPIKDRETIYSKHIGEHAKFQQKYIARWNKHIDYAFAIIKINEYMKNHLNKVSDRINDLLKGVSFTINFYLSHLVSHIKPNNFAQGMGILLYHVLAGKKTIRMCKYCGIIFSPKTRGHQETCSDHCRKKYSKKKRKLEKLLSQHGVDIKQFEDNYPGVYDGYIKGKSNKTINDIIAMIKEKQDGGNDQ